MPSILSELEPLKVWLKYTGLKTVHQKSWIFLFHVVAFSDYIVLFETPSILSELEPIKVMKMTGQMVDQSNDRTQCNITCS